jgi:hypothetical protein
MTMLAWPTSRPYRPHKFEITLRDNARKSGESEETGTVQYTLRPGDRWHIHCEWNNQSLAERVLIQGKIAEGNGRLNTWAMWFFPKPFPTRPVTGTTYLSGAIAQGANTCNIVGHGAGSILSQGDFISIGGQLVCVTHCSESAGELVTQFMPRARIAFSVTTPVYYSYATGQFRLLTNGIAVPFGAESNEPFSADFIETW